MPLGISPFGMIQKRSVGQEYQGMCVYSILSSNPEYEEVAAEAQGILSHDPCEMVRVFDASTSVERVKCFCGVTDGVLGWCCLWVDV